MIGITLAQWEACFKRAVAELQLGHLRLSPHCLRHGAASSDFATGARRLDELQRRGRWKAAASVRRYEKSGRLAAQVAAMGPALLGRATRLAAAMPARFGIPLTRAKRSARR